MIESPSSIDEANISTNVDINREQAGDCAGALPVVPVSTKFLLHTSVSDTTFCPLATWNRPVLNFPLKDGYFPLKVQLLS